MSTHIDVGYLGRIIVTTNSDAYQRIRDFVFQQFPLAKKRNIGDDDSLLDNGIIDSLGVLDVVAFFEREFGIEISEDELLTDHFESIRIMTEFVQAKCNGTEPLWTT